MRLQIKFLALLLICSQVVGCASHKGQISNSNSSYSSEIAIGQEIHNQIISRIPLCTNDGVNQYIQEVGHNIAKNAKRDLPYQFIVLQDDRIYATYAPGGFVYITTGFLIFLKNESEAAFILAHEIGHLQRKDPRLSHAGDIMEGVLKTGSAVAPAFGIIGALSLLGVYGVYAATNRDISSESLLYDADTKALEMMAKAGYDPQSALNVYYELLNASSKELMYLYDYYQARPLTITRFRKLEKDFGQLDLAGKTFNTNRSHYMKMIKPLVPAAL